MLKFKFKQAALYRFLLTLQEIDCRVLFCSSDESLFENTYTYIVSTHGSNGMTRDEKETVLKEKFGSYIVKLNA